MTRQAGLAVVLAVACWAALAAAPPALAQNASSAIEGVVRTEEGRPAADAVVQARSEETGVARSAVTDAKGRYRIDLLEPGEWVVIARGLDGETSKAQTVTLRLRDERTLDLVAGSGLTETVEVRAEKPLVDPNRSGGELRLADHQVAVLPIFGRSITDLALLDSTILPAAPGGFYGERGSVHVINGQSGRANSFLVDGLDNNDQISGTTFNSYFSPNVIKDFVVLTRQYSAEYGRASGGVTNVITKRGGNESTAEVFVEGTRREWNDPGEFVSSLRPVEGTPDTPSRLWTGFNVGGPLKKDKAFYFLAYDHQESDDLVPYTGIDRDGRAGGWLPAPSRNDSLFLRTDFNLSPSNYLKIRVSGNDRSDEGVLVGGINTPDFGFTIDERDANLAATLTTVLSPNLLNEARLLVGGSSFDQLANSSRSGVSRPSGRFGGNELNRQQRDEQRFQIVDNLSLSRGPHTMKFGVDVTHSVTEIAADFNPRGNFVYIRDDALEPSDCGDLDPNDLPTDYDPLTFGLFGDCDPNGVDDDGDGVIDEPGQPGTYPLVYAYVDGKPRTKLRDTRFALFAQDSWEISPRWRFDYGLRYDLSTYTLPDSARVEGTRIDNGGAGRDTDNIAPRASFVFRPKPDGKLVFRGGAGVFYDKLVLGFPAVAAVTSGTELLLYFPQGTVNEFWNAKTIDQFSEKDFKIFRKALRQLGSGGALNEIVLRFSTGTELDTPYAVQANLEAERAVGDNHSCSIGVTRSRGYHTPLFRDINPVTDPGPITEKPTHRDNTTGSIAAIVTEGATWYTGVDAGWQGRGARGWYAVKYTWSKAEDLGPDPLKGGISLPPNSDDLDGERGRSDSDRRHRVVISGETGLPFWGLRASGSIRYATGAPFNVTSGLDTNRDGFTNDRPKGVRRNTGEDTPLGPVNDIRRRGGLAPIDRLREPDIAQVDLKIAWPFLLKQGRAKAELYANVFNVFDRFNGGPVEGRVLSKDFGSPIGLAGPPRTLEFGLKAGF